MLAVGLLAHNIAYLRQPNCEALQYFLSLGNLQSFLFINFENSSILFCSRQPYKICICITNDFYVFHQKVLTKIKREELCGKTFIFMV